MLNKFKLKVVSYNCCSLNKNIDVVRELSYLNIDILFLQETFVTDGNLGLLDFVDENYCSIGVGAVFSEDSLISGNGRPMGGLACIYRANAGYSLKMVYSAADVMMVMITISGVKTLLVNTYIRSDLGDASSLQSYLDTLNLIENKLEDFDFDSVFICGDFNADPAGGRAWTNLSDFADRNLLRCFDTELLPVGSFTHVSYGYSYCKWLDHFLGKSFNGSVVDKIEILEECIGSDHLPVVASITIPVTSMLDDPDKTGGDPDTTYVDWGSLQGADLSNISVEALNRQGSFWSRPAVKCHLLGCSNRECIHDLDRIYTDITDSVNLASQKYSKDKIRKNKYRIIPGWNRNVKDSYLRSRDLYKVWLSCGKPRDHISFNEMKQSRSDFKSRLNVCRNNENNEILLTIEEKFRSKNMKKFWEEVKRRKGGVSCNSTIDGAVDEIDIVKIFTNKFLCNQEGLNVDYEDTIINNINSKWNILEHFNTFISSDTIKTILKKLNAGKGHDNIHSSLLIVASREFLDNIACFINACYKHCYIPVSLLQGTITPIVKDNKGNKSDSANYRPIMQSSYILKIIESHLLLILEEKLNFNKLQFGFVQNASTTDAAFLLKEVVHSYISKNNKVFANFIDMSKAFDKVDHSILIRKLINANVPIDIVRLLAVYLRNQRACVRWGNHLGECYMIERGVRQGGVLSPLLFKFYVNSIIDDICKFDIGCKLGLKRINIIAYADDFVLIGNSLESLVFLCSQFMSKLNSLLLKINEGKSKVVIFKKGRKADDLKELYVNGVRFEAVSEFKYLGHIINFNLDDSTDVNDKLNKFYASFNSVNRSFNGINLQTILHLFNSYCCPQYGLQLWNTNGLFLKQNFQAFSIAYNNAIKKMLNCPRYASSHIAAEVCQQLMLRHVVALTQARYLKICLKLKSHVFSMNLLYLKQGRCFTNIANLFSYFYNIDLYTTPLDVIKSRIIWVQTHEPRARFCQFFNK